MNRVRHRTSGTYRQRRIRRQARMDALLAGLMVAAALGASAIILCAEAYGREVPAIPTKAPAGYTEAVAQGVIDPGARPEEIAYSRQLLITLQRVNDEINGSVVYVTGPNDAWRPAESTGDCEDIALAKRERLMAMGYPPGALRMTVGRIPGGAHAVLSVMTNRGSLIMDSVSPKVASEIWYRSRGYDLVARAWPGVESWEYIGLADFGMLWKISQQ